jgi:PhnB protein
MKESPMTYIPQGRGALAPGLAMPDLGAAIEFYRSAFGACEHSTFADSEGVIRWAMLDIDGSALLLGSDEETDTTPEDHPKTCISLYVADVDATTARAHAAGAVIKSGPIDREYGVREAGLIDPFGINWWVSTPRAH